MTAKKRSSSSPSSKSPAKKTSTSSTSSSNSNSNSTSSALEISKQIKMLIKELPEERSDATRLDELRRLYSKLVANGELQFGGEVVDRDKNREISSDNVRMKWNNFLLKHHKIMISQLSNRIRYGCKKSAIRCFFGVIASSPITRVAKNNVTGDMSNNNGDTTTTTTYNTLNSDLLRQWIHIMTQMMKQSQSDDSSILDKSMKHMIESEFIVPYRDVQYYTLKSITILATNCYDKLMKEEEQEGDDTTVNFESCVAEMLLQFLLMVPVPTSSEEIETQSQYLFPLPKNVIPQDGEGNDDNDDEEEEEEGDSSDDSEDEDNDSSSSSSEEEGSDNDNDERPSKRQRKMMTLKEKEKSKLVYQQIRCFRREQQKAWLAILKLPLSTSSMKHILQYLPEYVLNNVAQPLKFSDFFMKAYTDNYDEDEEDAPNINESGGSSSGNSSSGSGGIIGILALNGLFILLTEYGLEYNDFYKQLYKLVTPRIFHVKYRTKFVSLLTKCLMKNEMLPGHIIASFIKRLCRITMSIPPSSILSILALISNLLRKHPECLCLIHRGDGGGSGKGAGGVGSGADKLLFEDKFVSTENDPTKTCALQSSLWELVVLERHYYSPICTMAKSIGRIEEMKAPLHDIDGTFSHFTYKSLFDTERKSGGSNGKKRTQKTSLTFVEPKSLFMKDDIFADILKAGP